jgi:hypothetical protein
MLVGLSIRSSAADAAGEVRASIRTGVVIELNPVPGDQLFDLVVTDAGETQRVLKAPLLAESRLGELLAIDGVGGYFLEEGEELLHGAETPPRRVFGHPGVAG